METIYTNNKQSQPIYGKQYRKRYVKVERDTTDPYMEIHTDQHDRFKVRGPITNFCCNFTGEYADLLKRAIQDHCFSNGMANYFFDRELSARQVVFLLEKNKELLTNSYFGLAMRIKLKKINDNKDKTMGLDSNLRSEILREDYEEKEIGRLAIKEVKKDVKKKKNSKKEKIQNKIKEINIRIKNKEENGIINYEDNYTTISELKNEREYLNEKLNKENIKDKFDDLIGEINQNKGKNRSQTVEQIKNLRDDLEISSTEQSECQSVISLDKPEEQSRVPPVKVIYYDKNKSNYSLEETKRMNRGYKVIDVTNKKTGVDSRKDKSQNTFIYKELKEGKMSIRYYFHKNNFEEEEIERVNAREKLNEYMENIRKLRLGKIKHFAKPLEIKDPDYERYFMPAIPNNKKSWFNMFA